MIDISIKKVPIEGIRKLCMIYGAMKEIVHPGKIVCTYDSDRAFGWLTGQKCRTATDNINITSHDDNDCIKAFLKQIWGLLMVIKVFGCGAPIVAKTT